MTPCRTRVARSSRAAKPLSATSTSGRFGIQRRAWRTSWRAQSVSFLCRLRCSRLYRSEGARAVRKGSAQTRPAPWDRDQHHQAEPAQAACLDEVAVAGADRVAVDPLGLDVFAAPALDGVVEAKDDRPLWHEGVQQQPEQHTRCGTPAPGGAGEDAMIVHEPPLPTEPDHAENAGHRALARRQNGSDQQHLGMAPTPLEEQRRKAEDHSGEAGWQSEHGGGPVAGTPQPNRTPAPLLQARKWPNSS